MPNPKLIPVPFAQDTSKNDIPLEKGINDPSYTASWKGGFPPETMLPKDLGGQAPNGLDFNGLFYALSQAVVFLQKGNAYQFDESLAPYPIGALVRSNDDLTTYQSIIPDNSNNPNANMTGWRVYNGSGFVVDNLTTNDGTKALSAKQGKALSDGKLNKTDLKDASTTQKGIVQLNDTLTSTSTTQALTAAQGKNLNDQAFGVGQVVRAGVNKVANTTYTNNTKKTILVTIRTGNGSSSNNSEVLVNGLVWTSFSIYTSQNQTITFPVPSGATYRVNTPIALLWWSELTV